MIPTARNDPQPWNDPQIAHEMEMEWCPEW